jgi:hypothetical protein
MIGITACPGLGSVRELEAAESIISAADECWVLFEMGNDCL